MRQRIGLKVPPLPAQAGQAARPITRSTAARNRMTSPARLTGGSTKKRPSIPAGTFMKQLDRSKTPATSARSGCGGDGGRKAVGRLADFRVILRFSQGFGCRFRKARAHFAVVPDKADASKGHTAFTLWRCFAGRGIGLFAMRKSGRQGGFPRACHDGGRVGQTNRAGMPEQRDSARC
jgi:hypothetical protein